MIAVDSSVWINFIRDRRTASVQLLRELIQQRPESVLMVDLVYTEILRGVSDRDVARTEELLSGFEMLKLRHMADFRAAAGLYRAARSKGFTIRGTVDCLIAAICIREDVPLLHDDVDFDRLADVATLSVVKV
jgi:hypothetical protein